MHQNHGDFKMEPCIRSIKQPLIMLEFDQSKSNSTRNYSHLQFMLELMDWNTYDWYKGC